MAAPILFVLALTASVPTLNLERSCRGAQSGALPEDRASAYKSCLHDEQEARRVLQRKWNQIPAAARTSCVDEATGSSPSYVELLTCLEMRTGGNFSTGVGTAPAAPAPAPATPSTPGPGTTPGATGTTPGATDAAAPATPK
jgi:hypothetical protein